MESEGGVAKELVSEENGMLISAIIRQYFMSLKILGRWKRWCTKGMVSLSPSQLIHYTRS